MNMPFVYGEALDIMTPEQISEAEADQDSWAVFLRITYVLTVLWTFLFVLMTAAEVGSAFLAQAGSKALAAITACCVPVLVIVANHFLIQDRIVEAVKRREETRRGVVVATLA